MYDALPGPYGRDPHAGYAAATGATATGRDAEAKIFGLVISRLKAAEAKRKNGEIRAMAEAIYDNDRLWLALSVDILHKDNKLPAGLRSQLLDLASFSRAHGRKVLLGEGDVQELVDVNAAVMRGLRGKPLDNKDERAA